MVMGVMDIEEIKLFLAEIMDETSKISELIPKGKRLVEFQARVQAESIRRLYALP